MIPTADCDMNKASIITVGDEILIGQVIDTNSAWLGQQLSDLGVSISKIWSVGDDLADIISALGQACTESDIVFVTGGLGPTKDDITKKAIADFLRVEMVYSHTTYEKIKRLFDRLGRPMSPSHDDQCLMPDGAILLNNSMGTAPGMKFLHLGKVIISMPGVPYEMKSIMLEEVIPDLKKQSTTHIIHKTILTCGAGETTIEDSISDIIADFPAHITIAYLPGLGQVRLRLSGRSGNKTSLTVEIEDLTQKIVDRLGDLVFGYGETTLQEEIQRIMISKRLTLTTAESCTGGSIASQIVSIPGSSQYFLGSIVAYSNEIKTNVLKVTSETLDKYGAVSEQTVIQMTNGALNLLNADIAVAVSGIAGPDGGTAEKPVGTIWICVGNKDTKVTYLLKSGKNRQKNIEVATVYALNMIRKFVLTLP